MTNWRHVRGACLCVRVCVWHEWKRIQHSHRRAILKGVSARQMSCGALTMDHLSLFLSGESKPPEQNLIQVEWWSVCACACDCVCNMSALDLKFSSAVELVSFIPELTSCMEVRANHLLLTVQLAKASWLNIFYQSHNMWQFSLLFYDVYPITLNFAYPTRRFTSFVICPKKAKSWTATHMCDMSILLFFW